MNCFRYLNCSTLRDVKLITLNEYTLRMQAFRLKKVDDERDMHLQAWINLVVKSTDKKGKPTYKNFTDFYDYEKRIREVSNNPQKCEKTEKNNHLFLVANNLKNMRKEVNNG